MDFEKALLPTSETYSGASPLGEAKASQLSTKASDRYHPFEFTDVKDLVKAINDPIAIFSYGNKEKAQNVMVELERDGKKFVVGIHFNMQHGNNVVNDIRGLFNKDNHEWNNWIQQGKMLYVHKQKIQALIDKQRTNLAEVEYLDLDSIANIIETFGNTNEKFENFQNNIRFRTSDELTEQFGNRWSEEQTNEADGLHTTQVAAGTLNSYKKLY